MIKKDCYGKLNRVFPVGEKGFREVVPECFHCPERTPCLKDALSTQEGLEMKAEILDRATASGLMGRLQMWSQKKEIDRLIKQQKEKKK
ncbi:MAG: hypothetical protein SV375_17355 [Thermodesulfobacteriota bacterium]|nr:hypothetical protein [Thermodesulfobacteriota bacterium]